MTHVVDRRYERVCVLYPDDPCGGPAVRACMCVVSR